MLDAGSKDYWNQFYQAKVKTGESITRNEILSAIFSEAVAKNFLPKKNEKVLELGCGQSVFLKNMALQKYQVWGLDVSQEAIDYSKALFKKNNLKGNFEIGDALKLPYKDDSFDLVYSGGLVDIFKDPTEVLQEMQRVLRPGGVLLAFIPNRRFSAQTIANIYNAFINWLKPLFGKSNTAWKVYRKNLKHANNYSRKHYREILLKLRLERVVIGCGYPLPELSLPGPLQRIYLKFLSFIAPRLRNVVFSRSVFNRIFGIYYLAIGTKK